MYRSNLLDSLRRELFARRLPASYVKRLMEEFEDHVTHLLQEHPGMDAAIIARRLGTPETLADNAEREYRRRTFAGRRPIWTFVIAPIPLTALLTVGWLLADYLTCCGVELVGQLAGMESIFEPPAGPVGAFRIVIYNFFGVSFCYLPAATACLLLGRSAARAGRHWIWALAACSLAALIAGCCHWLIMPITADRPSEQFAFGFGWPGLRGMFQHWRQILIPLALGGFAYFRARGTASRQPAAAAD
jgi:hypothetical protein